MTPTPFTTYQKRALALAVSAFVFVVLTAPVSKVSAAVIFITSGTSWTVPSDWNSTVNTIEVIGGGGGGKVGVAAPTYSGGGGGGGAYAKRSNVTLTPGASITYKVGAAGTASVAGGDTYFCNSTSNCASISGTAVSAGAKGGNGASSGAGASGGSSASSVGDTVFSGGSGGGGWAGGGGGGGGTAGPSGAGKAGGSMVASAYGGGGGGAGNNGSAASNTSVGNTGTAGGNNNGGSGGGAGGTTAVAGSPGSNSGGGGGGGGNSADSGAVGGAGGAGAIWTATNVWNGTSYTGATPTGGPGGGGGGGGGAGPGSAAAGATGGSYGAGGGGGGSGTSQGAGASGAQGIIVITYTSATAPTVTTNSASSVVSTSAILSGAITATGGQDATQSGFAYGTVSSLSTVIATTTLGAQSGAASFNSSVSSLTGNTTYYYRAYATNSMGTAYGSIGSFLTLPDTPAAPSVGSVTATTTSVSWSAPTGGVASYKLQYCVSGSSPCVNSTGLAVTSTTTNPLVGNTTYSFAVRGTNATGDGLFSASTTQLTLPDRPTSLVLSGVTATTTLVSWTAPTGGASSYKLTLCQGVTCSVYAGISGVSTTTYSLVGNTTYTYSILATNATGDSLSTATSTQLTAPDITGTPTFSNITADAMRVSWTAPAGSASTYKLERCAGSGCSDYVSVSTGIAALFFDDSGLSANATYRYRVRATNATGDGLYSAGAEQTTSPNPPTVTTQAASSLSATTATLNGTIVATGGANATVRGFAYSSSATLASGVSTTTNNGDYGAGAFTENISSLTGNTVYYYRPYATNGGGTSYGSIELFLTYPSTPDAASYDNTTATTTGVLWSEALGGAASYELTQCQEATCFVFSAISGNSTTTYSLAGNTTYGYAVRGNNATGYTAFSATTTRLTLPGMPGTPSFSAIEDTSLALSWTGPVGSTSSYKIERCTGSACSDYSQIASGVGTASYSDTGLMSNTTYRYRVRATNATGDGLYSAGAETTTDMVPPSVVTDNATGILSASATLNGTITATGGATATTRGFAWGINAALGAGTATTTESGTFDTGVFEAILQSLVQQTTYYFRAYATNSMGTSFGSILSFVTAQAARSGGGAIGGDAPEGQGIVGGGGGNGGEDIGGVPPGGSGTTGGGGGGGGEI